MMMMLKAKRDRSSDTVNGKILYGDSEDDEEDECERLARTRFRVMSME